MPSKRKERKKKKLRDQAVNVQKKVGDIMSEIKVMHCLEQVCKVLHITVSSVLLIPSESAIQLNVCWIEMKNLIFERFSLQFLWPRHILSTVNIRTKMMMANNSLSFWVVQLFLLVDKFSRLLHNHHLETIQVLVCLCVYK